MKSSTLLGIVVSALLCLVATSVPTAYAAAEPLPSGVQPGGKKLPDGNYDLISSDGAEPSEVTAVDTGLIYWPAGTDPSTGPGIPMSHTKSSNHPSASHWYKRGDLIITFHKVGDDWWYTKYGQNPDGSYTATDWGEAKKKS